MVHKFVDLFPKSFLSFIIGLLVDIRFPQWMLKPAIKLYCGFYRVQINESMHPIDSFKTFNDFFTRELKPGLRPISNSQMVHPCDAKLIEVNKVTNGRLLTVKGQQITVKQLIGPLADNPALETAMACASFALYYLSPKDYHRVHHPVDGQIVRSTHIPGDLWPVNQWALDNVEALFFKNERVVTEVKTLIGDTVYIVMAGALNVGRMTMSYDQRIKTNASRWQGPTVYKYKDGVSVKKGNELGLFNMGSSVVLVAPSKYFTQNLIAPIDVKVGDSI